MLVKKTDWPLRHDKWDLIAAEILADPELAPWPLTCVEHVMNSEAQPTWTPKQRSDFKHLFVWRFGWAFFFGTFQEQNSSSTCQAWCSGYRLRNYSTIMICGRHYKGCRQANCRWRNCHSGWKPLFVLPSTQERLSPKIQHGRARSNDSYLCIYIYIYICRV